MREPPPRPRWLALAIGLLSLATPALGDDRVTIVPREPWSDVFGGEKVDLHFAIRAREPFRGRLAWIFAIERRTLARGEVEVDPARPAEVPIQLDIPPVKPGVILRASLGLTLTEANQARPAASLEKPVWIFPRDPFADRTRWLEGLKIRLFDPQGGTATVFEAAKIPFERAHDVPALTATTEGMVVIGEGVSFQDDRDLPGALIQLAASGRPVLCLAPVAGALPFPGSEDDPPNAPRRLEFRRQDIITTLDKRLDAEAWPPDGKVVASGVVPKAEGGSVVGEVSTEGGGWPWVEVGYPSKRGKLVIAGFGLNAHWEAGPAPRFLLARLFEHLDGEDADQAKNPERTER